MKKTTNEDWHIFPVLGHTITIYIGISLKYKKSLAWLYQDINALKKKFEDFKNILSLIIISIVQTIPFGVVLK